MTPRNQSKRSPSPPAAAERENDPRFVRLCRALADEPRLAKSVADLRAAQAAGDGDRFDPGHGRVMKEWVVITNPRLRWRELATDAHDFVARGSVSP